MNSSFTKSVLYTNMIVWTMYIIHNAAFMKNYSVLFTNEPQKNTTNFTQTKKDKTLVTKMNYISPKKN